MYGYATTETKQYLPLPFVLANDLAKRLTDLRHKRILPILYPDGKTQVTMEYDDKTPKRVQAVVIAAQHKKNINPDKLRETIIRKVIRPTVGEWMDNKTQIFINSTGIFNR